MIFSVLDIFSSSKAVYNLLSSCWKIMIMIVVKMFRKKLHELPIMLSSIKVSVICVDSVEHAQRKLFSIVVIVMILFLPVITHIMLYCRVVRLYHCLSLPSMVVRVSMHFVELLCLIIYIIVSISRIAQHLVVAMIRM